MHPPQPKSRSGPAKPIDSNKHCQDVVRQGDKDRFLAGLFVPAAHRPAIYALFAFNVEVMRVRDVVSDPLPGEMRLQWWRDCLNGAARGDVAGHPVAIAILAVIERYGLPREPFLNLIEARTFDLYDDPMPCLGDLEGYAGETESALMQLAAIVMNDGERPDTAEIAGHAGVALSITTLLRAFPRHASRGQVYVPEDILRRHGVERAEILAGKRTIGLDAALAELRDVARDHIAETRRRLPDVEARLTPALLPAALAPPYLDLMDRNDYDPFRTPVAIPQWRRQWMLWRSARMSKRISG